MDQNLLSHNLKTVFILRLISTVSFGVFFCSLSLIMLQTFHLTAASAASLSALFFGFYYTLPLLGGRVGDYVKNYKQMFITGKCFQLISTLILIYAIKHQEYLYLGLGLFLVDSMVSTISLNMFITNCFDQKNTAERGVAFVKAHVYANIGFILALILSGAIYRFFSIDFLFYVSAVFSVVTLLYSYFCIKQEVVISTDDFLKKNVILILIMLSVSIITTIAFMNYYLTRELIIIAGFVGVLYIFTKTMMGASKEEKKGILNFMIFMLCSLLFWSVDMLGPTFLPVFISSNVNTKVFGFQLPPQWLQIISPITIVILGLVLSKIVFSKYKISRANIFTTGLCCTAIGLVLLNLGMHHHILGLEIDCIWIISYLIIMAIAEIFIAPAGTAIVGDYIVKKYQGIYTGITQMIIGFSVIFSGMLAEYVLTPNISNTQNTGDPSNIYILKLILTIVVFMGIVIFTFDKNNNKDVRSNI